MLLKVRLPGSIPPIPKMSLSMNDVDLTLSALPSSSTILFSMVAVFVLLSFVRALFIGLKEHLAFVKGRKAKQEPKSFGSSTTSSSSSSPSSEKSSAIATSTELQQQQRRPTSSWLWGLVKWDTLPVFPLDAPSLQNANVTAGVGRGAGVGMSEKQGWIHAPQPQQGAVHRQPVVVTRRPGGPAFERPLATLYQSDMPISMAKMIMSRHTFRRPSSRPPPARPATVQIQVQRRVASPSPTPLLPRGKPTTPIMIPTSSSPSSSLSRPTSPPSRSPSPPSPASSSSTMNSNSRTPSPTSPSSSRSGSRSPSPTSSSPRLSPSLEDLLELQSRTSSLERGSIV